MRVLGTRGRPVTLRGLLRSRNASRGQALVEFSLVIPVFLVIFLAVFEFGFVLNAQLSINFATRDAALIAAEAGNAVGSDCVILQKVEQDVTAPASANNIQKVQIFWTNSVGDPLDTSGNVTTAGSGSQAVNVYLRTGSTTCTFAAGPSLTVPYTLSGTARYPESSRCNDLQGTSAGCLAGHPGLDTVAVAVTYLDTWRTPLHNLIGPLGSSGWTLGQSNEMRMEPIL
jgi:Flp pilus assembly protein TadG